MRLKKIGMAGTLESSDVQIIVEPIEIGVEISIKSTVVNQYGRQIKATILETVKKLNLDCVRIDVVDKGALDCTIKARLECAVFRGCEITENFPWGGETK